MYCDIAIIALWHKSDRTVEELCNYSKCEIGVSGIKISYNGITIEVLGDFPLTRRHVYTKCVSCDGHRKHSGPSVKLRNFRKTNKKRVLNAMIESIELIPNSQETNIIVAFL